MQKDFRVWYGWYQGFIGHFCPPPPPLSHPSEGSIGDAPVYAQGRGGRGKVE